MDFLKIIFGFIMTGIIGGYVSHRYQTRNTRNQLYFKKNERIANNLKEIRDTFSILSSERFYRCQAIIGRLRDGEDYDSAYREYMNSVHEWNKKINFIFIEMSNQNVYEKAMRIEKSVHNNFSKAHAIINREISNKILKREKNSELKKALEFAGLAYQNTLNISNELTEDFEGYWREITNADSVKLNDYNLHNASNFTLIIALFHKFPYRLRISRSRFDE